MEKQANAKTDFKRLEYMSRTEGLSLDYRGNIGETGDIYSKLMRIVFFIRE